MSTKPPDHPLLSLGSLLGDFRLLLTLFLMFRLLMILAYQPLMTAQGERGLTVGGDAQTYYAIASLSDSHGLPMIGWWSEFPPLWIYTSVLLYQLGGSYEGYALLFILLMTAASVGCLVLLRAIGTHLHGAQTGMALAWVYALMFAPLVFGWWTFEPLVTFFLLLGLWWLLQARTIPAAVAAGLGALVKFTPALLLGAVIRYRTPKTAALFAAVMVGVFALPYVPLLLTNAAMTVPSVTAQFSKASYQTVWALLDGNYRTGNFGPLNERLDPLYAYQLVGNPSVVPSWVRLGLGGAVGLWLFLTARRRDARGVAAFVALTVLIFFLQAQGWSPQWIVQIIPLVLLCLPNRRGIVLLLVVSFLTLAEYPFLFLRTGDTGGVIAGALVVPYVLFVSLRTLVLVWLCVPLAAIVRQRGAEGV
jgi:hypothetical protein